MNDIGYRSTEFNSKFLDPFILEVVEKKNLVRARKQFQLGANPSLSLPSLDSTDKRSVTQTWRSQFAKILFEIVLLYVQSYFFWAKTFWESKSKI